MLETQAENAQTSLNLTTMDTYFKWLDYMKFGHKKVRKIECSKFGCPVLKCLLHLILNLHDVESTLDDARLMN